MTPDGQSERKVSEFFSPLICLKADHWCAKVKYIDR